MRISELIVGSSLAVAGTAALVGAVKHPKISAILIASLLAIVAGQ